MTINEKLDNIMEKQTVLMERVPEDLKETIQSLKDAQEYGCPALRGHFKDQKKAWWAVGLAFIVAAIALFKDILGKKLGIQ